MISLVKLQLSLHSESAESIQQILTNLGATGIQLSEELKNKNLKYDPKEGWLQFDCLYRRSICKVRLGAETDEKYLE